jgi:hypothetical protein
MRFAIDQMANPDSIVLTHGGLNGAGVLVSGRVATISGTPAAKRLQAAFCNAIARRFPRVNAFHVGPAAGELLRRGGRLTPDASSPAEFDLAARQ